VVKKQKHVKEEKKSEEVFFAKPVFQSWGKFHEKILPYFKNLFYESKTNANKVFLCTKF
jgi:hypothetical protein